jgi:predicted CopG family antitoxin
VEINRYIKRHHAGIRRQFALAWNLGESTVQNFVKAKKEVVVVEYGGKMRVMSVQATKPDESRLEIDAEKERARDMFRVAISDAVTSGVLSDEDVYDVIQEEYGGQVDANSELCERCDDE